MSKVLTTQELFNSSIMAFMAELEGGKLKKYCDTKTQKGGESITFNRMGESTSKDGLTSMYSTGEYVGDGGEMKAIKVEIAEISSQEKIKESEMAKTTVDIKNTYVQSMSRAIVRKEDLKVLNAIEADIANVNILNVTGYEADADVKAIIAQIRETKVYADFTPDDYTGTALVISAKNWAKLSTSEYVLNADYNAAFGGSADGSAKTFFGVEVIIINDALTVADSYLIPSNVICLAEWEGSLVADAIFHPTDMRRWHLQIVKSIAAKTAEPGQITKIVVAP